MENRRFPRPTSQAISFEVDIDYDKDSLPPSSVKIDFNGQLRHRSVRRSVPRRRGSSGAETNFSRVTVLEDKSHAKRVSNNPKPRKTAVWPLVLFVSCAGILISFVLGTGGVVDTSLKATKTIFSDRESWDLPPLKDYPNNTAAVDLESCISCCQDLNHRFDGNIINNPEEGQEAPSWDLMHYWTCAEIGCVAYEFDCEIVTEYVNNSGKEHPRGNSIRGCQIGQDIRTTGNFVFMPPHEVAAKDDELDIGVNYEFTCDASQGSVILERGITGIPTYPPNMWPAPTNYPTAFPTTAIPTSFPTTASPTTFPTTAPTEFPTISPTHAPSPFPTTASPTNFPVVSPTEAPTLDGDTDSPTKSPTPDPTVSPTESPAEGPTKIPTGTPTDSPSVHPTDSPTDSPSKAPTSSPSKAPTRAPLSPTQTPTFSPTKPGETRAPTTTSPTTAPISDEKTATPTIVGEAGDDVQQVNNLAWIGGVAGVSSSSLVAGMLNFQMIF